MNIYNSKINISSKLFVVLILSVVTALYLKTVSYELIFLDDDILIYEKFVDKNFTEKLETTLISNYLDGKYYRPIALLTFLIESEISGQSLYIYHLSNFIIHLFTCIILFYLLLKLSYIPIVSLLAALFFAINPIHINAVGWIAGRGDLLAGFFSISAFYIYLKFIRSGKLVLIIPVSFFLLLAFLSKESALIVPFLFVMFYFLEKKDFAINKITLGVLLIFISSTGTYYFMRGLILTDVHLTKFSLTTFYHNILVLPDTISKVFIPTGVKALPGIDLTTSVIGIIIIILIIILPLLIRRVNKLRYYFGFLWFAFLMFPGMIFRTMLQDGFFYWDCRSYLPIIGMAIVLAELYSLFNFNKIWNWLSIIILIYFLTLGTTTFIKINLYRDPLTYWNSVISDYPDRFLPHIALYNYYIHHKESGKAENELLKGIAKNPNASPVRKMLFNFYISNGQKEKVFSSVKDALEQIDSDRQFFIDKFISLSIETDNIAEIEYLLSKYSKNKRLTEMINTSLKKVLQNLINADDKERAEKLRQKLLRL